MKKLKKLYTKVLIAAAIIGIIFGCTLKGIQIHKELTQPNQMVAPMAKPVSQKSTYSLTWSHEVVAGEKK